MLPLWMKLGNGGDADKGEELRGARLALLVGAAVARGLVMLQVGGAVHREIGKPKGGAQDWRSHEGSVMGAHGVRPSGGMPRERRSLGPGGWGICCARRCAAKMTWRSSGTACRGKADGGCVRLGGGVVHAGLRRGGDPAMGKGCAAGGQAMVVGVWLCC